VKLLIENGAKEESRSDSEDSGDSEKDAKSDNGTTAPPLAKGKDDEATAMPLREQGAEEQPEEEFESDSENDSKADNGSTALLSAAEKGCVAEVRGLL
jgi:hypothetical protein